MLYPVGTAAAVRVVAVGVGVDVFLAALLELHPVSMTTARHSRLSASTRRRSFQTVSLDNMNSSLLSLHIYTGVTREPVRETGQNVQNVGHQPGTQALC